MGCFKNHYWVVEVIYTFWIQTLCQIYTSQILFSGLNLGHFFLMVFLMRTLKFWWNLIYQLYFCFLFRCKWVTLSNYGLNKNLLSLSLSLVQEVHSIIASNLHFFCLVVSHPQYVGSTLWFMKVSEQKEQTVGREGNTSSLCGNFLGAGTPFTLTTPLART